ncbi:GNAT family N-acetyltransferase [Terasakiella sp.]|uniref:GNAT family N-acetyltransferase n=1 Tax=Terasakiella sp. TaxID=2034861 RepID=UPI003AA7B569
MTRTTTILRLREVRAHDSPKYFDWINNRDLVHLNATYQPISSQAHEDWFSSITKHSNLVIFSIVLSEENKPETLIGSCSLRNIDHLSRTAELQIRIGEQSAQNKGWGSQAVGKLLEFGFNDLNLNRIYLDVFTDNKRAVRTYEKNGFHQEGIKKQAVFINGEYKDVCFMAILKNDYAKK